MLNTSTEELKVPYQDKGLKRYVEIMISVFMISLLFSLMIILAFKADIRAAKLMDRPIPYMLLFTNIVSILFQIYNIHTKKQKLDIYSIGTSIIALFLCNVVLGYCTYSYISTLLLEDLLILFLAGFLLKYIISQLANFISNIRVGRTSI